MSQCFTSAYYWAYTIHQIFEGANGAENVGHPQNPMVLWFRQFQSQVTTQITQDFQIFQISGTPMGLENDTQLPWEHGGAGAHHLYPWAIDFEQATDVARQDFHSQCPLSQFSIQEDPTEVDHFHRDKNFG